MKKRYGWSIWARCIILVFKNTDVSDESPDVFLKEQLFSPFKNNNPFKKSSSFLIFACKKNHAVSTFLFLVANMAKLLV